MYGKTRALTVCKLLKEGYTQAAVARLLNLSEGYVRRVVGSLIDAGIVRRVSKYEVSEDFEKRLSDEKDT